MGLEIVLLSFCPCPKHPLERKWHALDVRRALKFYLKRTEYIRNTDSLLVNMDPPPRMGARISHSSISRALRSCIKEAYLALGLIPPEGITVHSTRSAATSAAFFNRASTEEIWKAAAWSSISTFIRHYKINTKHLEDDAFGRRVLQQVIQRGDESPPGI